MNVSRIGECNMDLLRPAMPWRRMYLQWTQGGIDGPVVFEDIDRESLQVDKVARPSRPGQPVVRMLGAGKAIPNTSFTSWMANAIRYPTGMSGRWP